MGQGLTICVFGLGEAGSLLATELDEAGAAVSAYDPAEVSTPAGVERHVHPALAVRHADIVLAVTGGHEAKLAMLQSLDAVRSDAVYADLSTSSPSVKTELAGLAGNRNVDFADVALLSMVPGHGLATPALAAGSGAIRLASTLNEIGGRLEAIDGPPGAAAAKKLLRSIMMKGTAAVLIEALTAGAAVDDLEWLWSNVSAELSGADEAWMRRLVGGSKTHARRRLHEMEAAARLLDEVDVAHPMTSATIESLAGLLDGELPEMPQPSIPVDLESSVLHAGTDED